MSMHAIRFINTLGLLGITTVLLTGFCLQLTLHELPCPLCLLQRAGFTLLMFGFMLNVLEGSRPRHYAIILFAALFGCAVALRQILLHVIPGTPPYGSAVWHYHYYSWSFIIFFSSILACAVLLFLADTTLSPEQKQLPPSPFTSFCCWLAIATTAANAVAAFIECGLHACPPNPAHYWLFSN